MQDLSWSCHTNILAKMAQHCLYHIRHLRTLNYPLRCKRPFTPAPVSILTGRITAWLGNSTKQNRSALQRVVLSAECTILTELPDLQSIYSNQCWTKAKKIVKNLSHPNNGLFSLLQSGKRFHPLKANTKRMRRCFFLQAIWALNQGNT